MGRIERHPRLKLGHFPTAIEPLPRLGRTLGGASLFVKRDDATGMGQGGNKVRALEFIIPDARRANADILLTAGVVQSNSVRQVAAAAAKAGLGCHFGMITDRVGRTDPDYAQTGNILLDHLYGATHEIISIKDDRTDVLVRMADRFRSEGRRPYIVPMDAPTGWARLVISTPRWRSPSRSRPKNLKSPISSMRQAPAAPRQD